MKIERRRKLKKSFWLWLTRFAYYRVYNKRGKVPVGLPGNRDPDNVCVNYFPVLNPSGLGPCLTDGHYLCAECEWHEKECEESDDNDTAL